MLLVDVADHLHLEASAVSFTKRHVHPVAPRVRILAAEPTGRGEDEGVGGGAFSGGGAPPVRGADAPERERDGDVIGPVGVLEVVLPQGLGGGRGHVTGAAGDREQGAPVRGHRRAGLGRGRVGNPVRVIVVALLRQARAFTLVDARSDGRRVDLGAAGWGQGRGDVVGRPALVRVIVRATSRAVERRVDRALGHVEQGARDGVCLARHCLARAFFGKRKTPA